MRDILLKFFLEELGHNILKTNSKRVQHLNDTKNLSRFRS